MTKNRIVLGVFCGLALVFWAAPSALAHGTGYSRSNKAAVVLDFYYSTGETMSYTEFEVASPADPKVKWLKGRTDEDGRVAFVPNAPGDWTVAVFDDEGHRAVAEVNVTQEFLDGGNSAAPDVTPKAAAPQGLDLWLRCGLGVSLLFNVAAFVPLARRRAAKGV